MNDILNIILVESICVEQSDYSNKLYKEILTYIDFVHVISRLQILKNPRFMQIGKFCHVINSTW